MNKYAEWLSMATRLKTLKNAEMKLRKELCAEIFEGKVNETKKTFKFEGYEITANNAVTYKLDAEGIEAVWEELPPDEKQVIQWKPALILAAYKKLPSYDCMVHDYVTISPAAPTLKVGRLETDI